MAKLSQRLAGALVAGIVSMALVGASRPASAQWVSFVNETTTRMPDSLNAPALSTTDPEEKDYAWGDVDGDGDIDLVCVRKQPFTSPGRKPNVLFMNENGVLADRTAQYASATLVTETWNDPQVPGEAPLPDQGFITPTNDRDVMLADLDNDGWLDLVTATTLSDNTPKWIGHPRVYMNLGEIGGEWQGFRHEPNRIPDMRPASAPTAHPRFCSVAVGDVTGDGFADLYFGDYDSGGVQLYDYNNRLLINQGAANPGFFTDSQTERMSLDPGLRSAFGAASLIADMNGDGALDVVKQTSLSSPTHVAIQHNDPDPDDIGFFPDAGYKVVNNHSPYFVSSGDLNNDGRLDLIVSDDGDDRYHLNTGNGSDGTAEFASFVFSFTGGDDDGFGSQSLAADLDNDGWRDVLICDVDVDIGGCSRRLHIYRNLANGPNVTLQEQMVGGLNNASANMSGTHHVAVFDVNGDGWNDLVLGRCATTAVWINASIAFAGGPATFPPGASQVVAFDITTRGAVPVTGSLKIHLSQNGGPFSAQTLTGVDGDTYSATFPATPCGQSMRYYFSGQFQTVGGTQVHPFTYPSGGAASAFTSTAMHGSTVALLDQMEGSVAGWSVANDSGLTAGAWEVANPNGTSVGGLQRAPEDDATPTPGVRAFVTLNGTVGGAASASDVDGGSTRLVSPVLDLAGADAIVTYARWFSGSAASSDSLLTQVSNNNGGSWVTVETLTSSTISNGQTAWLTRSFTVGAYVAPSAQVRVRFTATDGGVDSTVEAGIDDFRVDELICTAPCLGDIAPPGGNDSVNVSDLLALIAAWGATGSNPADLNGDSIVNVGDLLAMIAAWGPCD